MGFVYWEEIGMVYEEALELGCAGEKCEGEEMGESAGAAIYGVPAFPLSTGAAAHGGCLSACAGETEDNEESLRDTAGVLAR